MTPSMDPVGDPVGDALFDVLRRSAALTGGVVADYIPELATADPDDFGVAVVSVLGQLYRAGDSAKGFTIQSISKAFVYAVALAEVGLDEVAARVGFEPSGEPFNAISLDPESGRPANPLINAGAIVASGLVPGSTPDERFEHILASLSAFAGRPLSVDERVYRSESDTGDRNRALAHLAKSAGVLTRPVDDAVEVYFRQCSVIVTAEDIAVMAATLANGGTNPLTGEAVVDHDVATMTMSVMATCGMYDRSGEWMVRVGLPAKSGVGGGIVAGRPGEFGIGTYSPKLDEQGNSVRGVAVLEALSAEFGLHLLHHHIDPRSPIASSTSAGALGEVEVRGELDLIAAEQIIAHLRSIVSGDGPTSIRLDVSGVTRVGPVAERLLTAASRTLLADGVEVIVVDPQERGIVSPSSG